MKMSHKKDTLILKNHRALCEADEKKTALTKPLMPPMTFAEPLVKWFQENKRTLPWREDKDAYHIWVSEIMLQQTSIAAVISYYRRFMAVLPDMEHLAACPEEKLLKLWEGLGYYSRVKNMKKAAVLMTEKGLKNLPDDYEELRSLPGIGPYTAGAVASLAFGIPRAAVDGNVLRVLSRLSGSYADNMAAATKSFYEKELTKLMEESCLDPGELNEGLMELGEVICLPHGRPSCGICPLKTLCVSYSENLTAVLPVRVIKTKRRLERKTVFLLEAENNIALCKRSDSGLLAGLYEFPNTEGHLEKKEALSFAFSFFREENTGECPGEALSIEELGRTRHLFSHVEWQMSGYRIRLRKKMTCEKLIWLSKKDLLDKYPLPAAFDFYKEIWLSEE